MKEEPKCMNTPNCAGTETDLDTQSIKAQNLSELLNI